MKTPWICKDDPLRLQAAAAFYYSLASGQGVLHQAEHFSQSFVRIECQQKGAACSRRVRELLGIEP